MKFLPLCITTFLASAVAFSTAGISYADDGTIFKRNASKTPELETGHASIKMLPLYVPAQASDGTLLTEGVDIVRADEQVVETRYDFQPLIIHYSDGHVETIDEIMPYS